MIIRRPFPGGGGVGGWATLLHDKHLLDFGRAEGVVGFRTHDDVVLAAHLVDRLLAKDLPVREHHREVVLVERFAGDSGDRCLGGG